MQKQAATAEEDGDLRAAGEMYMQIGKYKKAVEIFCKISALDSLISVVRMINYSPPEGMHMNQLKDSEEKRTLLLQAIKTFRKERHHAFAKETILKLQDIPMLINLHMELQHWEQAFQVCQKYHDY